MDSRVSVLIQGICVLLFVGIIIIFPASALNIMVFEQSDHMAPVPQALIYSESEYIATTDENGTYNLTYEGDPPRLRVAKAGYREWNGIPAINDTLILVPLQIRNCTYTIQIFDADTLLPVEDAQVKVGYGDTFVLQEHTGSNGTVVLPLRAEQVYDLTVISHRYQTIREKLITGFENADIQYSLIRNDRISILVKDSQDGRNISSADISIDGVESCKTNENGIAITNLSRGVDHTLEVTADGYERTILQKTPGDEDRIIDLIMVREKSPVFITVYDPEKKPVEGAGIRIDENETGYTNEYGRLTVPDLELRNYEFVVSREGYQTQRRIQEISSANPDIIFDLRPETISVPVIVENVHGIPLSNASILVNGSPGGLTDSNGTVLLSLEQEDSYLLTASMPGYFDNNTSVIPAMSSQFRIILQSRDSGENSAPFPVFTLGVGILVIAGLVIITLYLRGKGRRPSRSRKKRMSLRKRSL